MTSCWYCHEAIGAPTDAPVERVRRPHRLLRTVAGGCALAVALVVWEIASQNVVSLPPAAMTFEHRSLDEVGIAFEVPSDWEVELGPGRATFFSREARYGRSTRGLRAMRVEDPFSKAGDAMRVLAGRTPGYRRVSLRRTTVAGASAFLHTFTSDALHYDQWWVDGGRGASVRVDLWSPATDDDAPEVNRRIMRSAELL
jgi:hypothetical protein